MRQGRPARLRSLAGHMAIAVVLASLGSCAPPRPAPDRPSPASAAEPGTATDGGAPVPAPATGASAAPADDARSAPPSLVRMAGRPAMPASAAAMRPPGPELPTCERPPLREACVCRCEGGRGDRSDSHDHDRPGLTKADLAAIADMLRAAGGDAGWPDAWLDESRAIRDAVQGLSKALPEAGTTPLSDHATKIVAELRAIREALDPAEKKPTLVQAWEALKKLENWVAIVAALGPFVIFGLEAWRRGEKRAMADTRQPGQAGSATRATAVPGTSLGNGRRPAWAQGWSLPKDRAILLVEIVVGIACLLSFAMLIAAAAILMLAVAMGIALTTAACVAAASLATIAYVELTRGSATTPKRRRPLRRQRPVR